MKKLLLLLLTTFVTTALGADVTGTWKGSAETPNGTIERTFVFKAEGDKLTGETSTEMFGKSTIEDGKVDGDNISFSIKMKFQDNEMKITYKGKVTGDTLKLSGSIEGMDQTVEYTAKRVQ